VSAPSPSHQALHVDGERLCQRLDELGRIGEVLGDAGERGCARLALTDADRDGRNLVVGWMRDLGMVVEHPEQIPPEYRLFY